MKTDNPAKKKECLSLQEKLVKKLGEGSHAHKNFRKEMAACERRIAVESVSPKTEPKTINEKITVICRCVENQKQKRSGKMKCMMLQDQYAKGITSDEERKEFNLKTSSCF